MTIKSLFGSGRALSPWLSLAAPFVFLGLLIALKAISPSLFCVAINSGGKETICGLDYSHGSINLLRLLGLGVWVLLIFIGGAEIFGGRARWPAMIAWSVSALLFVTWAMLWMTAPVECTP